MELLLKRNEKPGTFGTRYDLFAKLEAKPEEIARIRKAKPDKTIIVEDEFGRNNFKWRLMLIPTGFLALIAAAIAAFVFHPILGLPVALFTWLPFRKLLFNGLLALLFTLLAALPAHAASGSGVVVVYNGPGLCVQGDATIDYLGSAVFSGNQASAYTYARSEGCGASLDKPDGEAAVRLDVYKWNGSDWYVCQSTDWTFGSTGTSRAGDILITFGPSQIFDYGGSSRCGPGYYGTIGYSYVWDWNGTVWRGGSVWSGHQYVP
jgi:hypothetical protein